VIIQCDSTARACVLKTCDTAVLWAQDNPLVQRLYVAQLGGAPFSPAARELLHTGYHARDKPTVTAMVGDW